MKSNTFCYFSRSCQKALKLGSIWLYTDRPVLGGDAISHEIDRFPV
jgi:hypothetical protein